MEDDETTHACPLCGGAMTEGAVVCSHCGRRPSDYDAKGRRVLPWWAFLLVIAAVSLAAWMFFQSQVDRSGDRAREQVCEVPGGPGC